MIKYKGDYTKEISFPLGGIGSGCIGLGGDGRLIDWEIFNRPNKGSRNGYTHFAIKAENEDSVIDARVLNGDLQPTFAGDLSVKGHKGYGFGPSIETMAGMPNFKDTTFYGGYPFAKMEFNDVKFPGSVKLLAFNPFIPLNDEDSSIPAAFFEFEVTNTTSEALNYTINLAMQNPVVGSSINRYMDLDGVQLIKMTSDNKDDMNINYGDATIATDAADVSYQEYGYRGGWFDTLGIYWREFLDFGETKNRRYPIEKIGEQDTCVLSAKVNVEPNSAKKIRYIISWSFPNCSNYWSSNDTCDCDGCGCGSDNTWKNYYVSLFDDSTASAAYSLKNFDRLYADTQLFYNTLFSSTLPDVALEAISANISILKSPTCLRMPNGEFYGFEGCICDSGCCEGSCTHVWNYAYALPFLFPKLERSMRSLDYKYNQDENGGMAFRLQLPLGSSRWGFRPCADGQFGGVLKVYREWKISGDTKWLESVWPAVKASIAYAWSDANEDRWDIYKQGVLTGRQHHTLDMELFGPNSWLTGFYVAALKAGAEIAEFLGETDTAAEYKELYNKGREYLNTKLFNGEYFFQDIDLNDKSLIEIYDSEGQDIINSGSFMDSYWNDEVGEIKYQIGEGSGIDQMLAQWHSNLIGLGEIFDKDKVESALSALYKYNFKKTMRNEYNPCRLFCLNDEGGIVICEWPKDKYKPLVPAPYSEETMNGFEYQAAIHMIQEGMVDNGLEIVAAIRDRYDGKKRNPWNEFECGSNYARSMASYALLLTYSGFEYNMVENMIGFNPIEKPFAFTCFWSLDSGWGAYDTSDDEITLSVLKGSLSLKTINQPFASGMVKSVLLNGEEIVYNGQNGSIGFDDLITIKENGKLTFRL